MMMPEEWPIAAPAADGNGPARPAGRGRLATVRRDFFLDPAERLTEQERALMTAMLHCLVSDVADAVVTVPSAPLSKVTMLLAAVVSKPTPLIVTVAASAARLVVLLVTTGTTVAT